MAKTHKTTLEIDEAKLERVMVLTGIKTRRAAVDYALDQAERAGRLAKVLEEDFFVAQSGEIIRPEYDVVKSRNEELPK